MVFRRVPLITCCEYNHKKRYVVKLNLEERDQLNGIINRERKAAYHRQQAQAFRADRQESR